MDATIRTICDSILKDIQSLESDPEGANYFDLCEDDGYFYMVTIPDNSKYSSLIDNLDKLIDGSSVPSEVCHYMKSKGHNIYPGERDSFGWLSACIDTKFGIIVFG